MWHLDEWVWHLDEWVWSFLLAADMSKVSVSGEDIDFMMQFVEGNKLELFFKFPHQKLLTEQIFRGRAMYHFVCSTCLLAPLSLSVVRVICCAFSESLSLYHWNKIAQWILSLLNKKLTVPVNKKISSTSITNISHADVARSARNRNRLSSVTGTQLTDL